MVSRHTGAQRLRCDLRAWNLNSWCRVPGNPFAAPVVVMPNHPSVDRVTLEFGPMQLPAGVDVVGYLLSSSDAPPHGHVHEVGLTIGDRAGQELGAAKVLLRRGESAHRSVQLSAAAEEGVRLGMSVAFSHFEGGTDFGNVSLRYLLAHQGNELIDLFNAAGSDKGTVAAVGGGVPHCYAVDYYELFREFRHERFRMLEIGLQADATSRKPTDAPSLRVWREFFPRAQIYGFDIEDFSFIEQDRTTTVKGDQGSTNDLQGFIDAHGREGFGLILDDGSHASSDQQVSLAALFDSVAPGGLYVIEDLHWQPRPESPTTLEVLRKFSETGRIESPFIGEEAARRLEAAIDRVEIHKPNDSEFAAIYKRAG